MNYTICFFEAYIGRLRAGAYINSDPNTMIATPVFDERIDGIGKSGLRISLTYHEPKLLKENRPRVEEIHILDSKEDQLLAVVYENRKGLYPVVFHLNYSAKEEIYSYMPLGFRFRIFLNK